MTGKPNPGPYTLVGARLIEMGYSAIPIVPGTKAPGTLRADGASPIKEWRTRFNRKLPSAFEVSSWSGTDAGVGIVCGYRDVIGVDNDATDPAVFAAIASLLPLSPARKMGAKGETAFFRGPGVPSKSFDVRGPDGRPTRAVDIIGDGRQTLLPPTIHPDTGRPYQWIGERALDEIEPEDLPLLDPDIIDRIAAALRPFGYVEPAPRAKADMLDTDEASPFRAVNNLAMGDFNAWVPNLRLYRMRSTRGGFEAVATWRSSNTGKPLDQRKLNLMIHPGGIRDFGMPEGSQEANLTPLDLVMKACDCDFPTAFKTLAHWTGWALDTPIVVAKPVAINVTMIPEPTASEVVEAAQDRTPEAREADADPDDLVNIPGVLGDVLDWITATARRPSRSLALGAALCVLGTLIGRRAATPTRSGTHLYVLGLAPTGAGKQHQLDCIERLMVAAKAGHHIGPSQFMSMTAVIGMLAEKSLAVCAQDEFGALLKKLGSNKASPHEQGVSSILRGLWGASFGVYRTPQWAGRSSERFVAPAVSIYGLSNPTEFYEALTGGDITNGFLNRFLVLGTRQWPEDRDPLMDPTEVPPRLAEALNVLYQWGANGIGNPHLNAAEFEDKPKCLAWADDAAQGVYQDLMRTVESRMRQDETEAPFFARTAEIALRVATIRAAGRWGPDAAVGADDMEWGATLSMRSSGELLRDAHDNMVEELGIGQLSRRVLKLVEAKGAISHRDLHRKMQHSVRKSSDLAEVMKSLETSGRILIEKKVPLTGGTPTITYRFAVG